MRAFSVARGRRTGRRMNCVLWSRGVDGGERRTSIISIFLYHIARGQWLSCAFWATSFSTSVNDDGSKTAVRHDLHTLGGIFSGFALSLVAVR